MVRCWFTPENSEEDQRNERQMNPPQSLSLDELYQTTGVEYFKIDADNYETDPILVKLKKERGYSYQDICDISEATLPNYHEKIKTFFIEHLHADEEIRLALSGSGYFDIRDMEDRWIRVSLSKGDMIIVPAGLYHRFTLDNENYIKALRLFVGEPVWTPHFRPAEDLESRKHYLQKLGSGAFSVKP